MYYLESGVLDHLATLTAHRTVLKIDFIDVPRRVCKDIHICTQKLLTLNLMSRQKFKFFHESVLIIKFEEILLHHMGDMQWML